MSKITFGIIALNAQPFLEYNLRALYPFAHQIIVVEGATEAAATMANAQGRSTDGTLEMLKAFMAASDPGEKLSIVSAIDEGYANGLWPEKDEMSRAYAKRTSGDWLWQVDSDEFYIDRDLEAVSRILDEKPEISGASFPFYEFWGGFDSVANGALYLHELPDVPRLFRWRPGYSYAGHRPPTVVDERGKPLNSKYWISGNEMRKSGVFMRHYSYVLPKQARQKVGYYANVGWTDAYRNNERWFQESYLSLKRPMFLNERGFPVLQWLEKYRGDHPGQIKELRKDLKSGKVNEPLRPSQDIERLLNSRIYSTQKLFAKTLLEIYWPIRSLWKKIRAIFVPAAVA